jgi:hypothetical protein
MNAREARALSIASLLDAYAKAARNHGATTLSGDYETGNRNAAVIARIYRELRRRGPAAQSALLDLLRHEDAGVRGWAGAHAMDFAPRQAIPVLEKLAGERNAIGFSAKMTLEVWEKGELRFP